MKGISRKGNNILRGMVSSNVSVPTPVNTCYQGIRVDSSRVLVEPIHTYVPPEGTWDKVKRLCKEYW